MKHKIALFVCADSAYTRVIISLQKYKTALQLTKAAIYPMSIYKKVKC